MIGKEIRLSQIIGSISRRTCLIPLDHAVTMGPIYGLENTLKIIEEMNPEDADAFIVHKGVFRQLEDRKDLLSKRHFILHLSASTQLGECSVSKCVVSSVEQAIQMGAIGISVHINLGNRYEPNMIQTLGMVSDQCYKWGMPLLAMMYVRNEQDQNLEDGIKITHAARIAQELGADIVKVSCPSKIQDLYEMTHKVQIPIVISGGEKMKEIEFIEYVNTALEAGVAGVSAGRNIFQSKKPTQLLHCISSLVHNQKTMDEIKEIMRVEE